jgi:hypothetical protein
MTFDRNVHFWSLPQCLDHRQQPLIYSNYSSLPLSSFDTQVGPKAFSRQWPPFVKLPRSPSGEESSIPTLNPASHNEDRFRPPPRSLAKPCRSRRAAESSPLLSNLAQRPPLLGTFLEELQSSACRVYTGKHPVRSKVPAAQTPAVMLCTTYRECRGTQPNLRLYRPHCFCRTCILGFVV